MCVCCIWMFALCMWICAYAKKPGRLLCSGILSLSISLQTCTHMHSASFAVFFVNIANDERYYIKILNLPRDSRVSEATFLISSLSDWQSVMSILILSVACTQKHKNRYIGYFPDLFQFVIIIIILWPIPGSPNPYTTTCISELVWISLLSTKFMVKNRSPTSSVIHLQRLSLCKFCLQFQWS